MHQSTQLRVFCQEQKFRRSGRSYQTYREMTEEKKKKMLHRCMKLQSLQEYFGWDMVWFKDLDSGWIQKRPSESARFWVGDTANTLRYKGPRMHCQNARMPFLESWNLRPAWVFLVGSTHAKAVPLIKGRRFKTWNLTSSRWQKMSIFDLPSRVLDSGCFSCRWDMSDMRRWKRKVFTGNVRRLHFLSPSSVL